MAFTCETKSLSAPAPGQASRRKRSNPIKRFFDHSLGRASRSDWTTEQANLATAPSLQGDTHWFLNRWVDLLEADISNPDSILELEAEIGYTAPLHNWRLILDDIYGELHHIEE